MLTLLPLATYTTSGSGPSVVIAPYKALRGLVDVTAFSAARIS